MRALVIWMCVASFEVLSLAVPAAAQEKGGASLGPMILAQAAAKERVPKRAQPIPNKPVSDEEAAKAARINNWTVGVAGGLLEGTFVRYAADMAKALDDGENLRVLPIISYGAVGNVSDLIYLKGVDIAITYSDVLDHFRNVEKIPGIERRVNYIIPMFQGEVHIYVRPEIKTLQDLAGKKVNFNTVGSAANYTGGIVFDRLGIKAERLFQNNSIALEGDAQGRDRGHRARSRQTQRSVREAEARARISFPAGRVQREVRGLLRSGRAHDGGLSQSDPAGRDGADDFRAGAACRLQLEARHRSLPAHACASSSICSIASRSCAPLLFNKAGRT